MIENDVKEYQAEQVVEQAPGSATITDAECMDRPDSDNEVVGEVCECRCCRQMRSIVDPEEVCGSRVCADCGVVEDGRDVVMRGPWEHWLDKRCGRWFVWYCDQRVSHDRFLCRIEPPAEDENLYYEEDGTLKGPDPWHGYDGNGEVKDGWVW